MPAEAARRFQATMAGFPGWWGVAGGWAIDLYLGRQTREHEDFEIVALRRDHEALHQQLARFHPSQIFPRPDAPPTFQRWAGGRFGSDVIQLRMERRDGEPDFDVLLTPAEGDHWICRRDESVRLPLPSVLRKTGSGVPVLAPEIVLLFKAKRTEPKDHSDFLNVLPSLDPAARLWLQSMLKRLYPGHEWLQQI